MAIHSSYRILAIALAGGLAGLLASCAGSSDQYPSLAIRDAERNLTSSAPTSAPTPEPLDPAVLAKVNALVAQSDQLHRQFVAREANALALARSARGLSNESDTRARALVAIASLATLRSQTAVALGGIDLAESEAKANFVETGKIEAAKLQVEEYLASQSASLSTANGLLGL